MRVLTSDYDMDVMEAVCTISDDSLASVISRDVTHADESQALWQS